ncbi:MAG: insulinase family protein [Oscillospiraceae bacterium]|nr:insulinase family protein [Oscillospiraceae bacterium]
MIEKKTLPSGVRLVYEPMDSVRSAAIGFWMGHGSRYEPEHFSGISHAIEHMVFKGTQSRSSQQVAEEMDAIGGQVNAFTTKESTCFYARSLDSHLEKATELLHDIFFHPRMDEGDWDTERGVILEEIGMYEDSPEDLASERLFGAIFPNMPLGRPIIGTPETLRQMTARDILDYRNAVYSPSRLVVSVAGRFSEENKAFLEEKLSSLAAMPHKEPEPAAYSPAITLREKPIEQNHFCLAFPGLKTGHEKRYVMNIMSGVLGTGMSSRLFRSVREEHGLCYSIYTFTAGHLDTGVFGVYSALGKNTERQALSLVREVLECFAKHGPGPDELDRVREQIKANLLMSLESSSSRMHHLGQHELMTGKIPEPDDIVKELDLVTADRVTELAQEVLDMKNVSLSVVGNPDNKENYQELLAH